MKANKENCMKVYGVLTFLFSAAVMVLFFKQAFALRSNGEGGVSVFKNLWGYILLILAVNIFFSLFFVFQNRRRTIGKEEIWTEKDSITQLDSFKSFLKRCPSRLEQYTKKGNIGAIVIVSMDDFKKINSLGGYEAGNDVLLSFSNHLKSFAGESELVARYFGDEIIMLLEGSSYDVLKERIVDIWAQSLKNIEVGEIEYILRVSIGAKIIHDRTVDMNTIINRATIAKVKAKQNGGDRCEFYTAEMDSRLKLETEIESALYHALENNEFYLIYQPIVDLEKNQITANEALLRWSHPKFKDVPILDVISIAERKGIIRKIGEWVLTEACKQNKKWHDEGIGQMAVSVNVSPVQMDSPDFVDTVLRALNESGLDPKYLQLEITETAVMQDVKTKQGSIYKLKSMGIRIAVDDFGTGYSSLSYFVNLPIDNLKIDKSFVDRMNVNENSRMIVDTIINMAKGMKITTTAEGVEVYKQILMLRNMGCNKIQGYLITKPVEPDKLKHLIEQLPEKEEQDIIESKTGTES